MSSYNKKNFIHYVIFCCLLFSISIFSQTLFINEFLASNSNTLDDEDGNSSDWIELYNNSNESVNLNGYTITDEADEPYQWTFPDIEILAKSYLIIWASGKNRTAGENLHTNFKLSADGEYIGLYHPDGSTVDSLIFDAQESDVSQGRWPDGGESLYFFENPTPGQSNQKEVHLTPSIPGGIYTSAISLELISNDSIGTIYYTTNGKIPTTESNHYTTPIIIDENTPIRASIIYEDHVIYELAPEIYLINSSDQLPISLPVISLITDPSNMYHWNYGIYKNYEMTGMDWERPVNIALYENNNKEFSINGGIRIHGDLSRNCAKKNFRLYFRNEYGTSRLEYPIFPDNIVDSFKRLILYAPSRDQCSQYANLHFTYLADVMSHALWEDFGWTKSDSKPVSLFLNADYMGLYWIRERIDKYFIEDHFGIEDMDLHQDDWTEWNVDIREGTVDYWTETLNFFKYNNFKISDNYTLAQEKYINLENITDYWILNIFIANTDWPQKNVDRYRDRINDPRWYWQLWDTDAGWRWYDHNTLQFAVRDTLGSGRFHDIKFEWSTVIIAHLLKNQDYKYYFINRFADLLNTFFKPVYLQNNLEYFKTMIADEIDREVSRWSGDHLPYGTTWKNNIKKVETFINVRPSNIHEDILQTFHLKGFYNIELLESNNYGSIQLNTLEIDEFPWKGDYLQNIPIKVTAVPKPGYQFLKWQGHTTSTSPKIEITATHDIQLEAIFVDQLQIIEFIVDSVDHQQAFFHWQMNHEAQSIFQISNDSLSLTTIDTLINSSNYHSLSLDTLQPQKTYFYKIQCWDALGDTITSDLKKFTTLKLPPSPANIDSIAIHHLSTDTVKIYSLTDQPTKAYLQYGLDENYNITLSDSILNREHNFILTPLLDSTLYHFTIRFENDDNLVTQIEDSTFTTLPDTVSPALLIFNITTITDTSASIQWITDEPAKSTFKWGLDTLNLNIYTQSQLTDTHYVQLHPLLPDTNYFIQICLSDHRKNISTSNWLQFETLKTPPAPPLIISTQIKILKSDSALISMTTDQSTITCIKFGTDTLYNYTLYDSSYVTNHSFWLSPLSDSTTYYYSIHYESVYGLSGIPYINNFCTPKDTIPPLFNDILVDQITDSSAIVHWKTKENTTGEICIGLSRESLYHHAIDTIFSMTHNIVITKLLSDTIYYYQVQAIDHRQNKAYSQINSFKTLQEIISGTKNKPTGIPQSFTLSQNYPNPFNQNTHWIISIPENGEINATIYDISGREVIQIINHSITTGLQAINWNGRNQSGKEVSSGLYLIRVKYKTIKGKTHILSQRLLLNR